MILAGVPPVGPVYARWVAYTNAEGRRQLLDSLGAAPSRSALRSPTSGRHTSSSTQRRPIGSRSACSDRSRPRTGRRNERVPSSPRGTGYRRALSRRRGSRCASTMPTGSSAGPQPRSPARRRARNAPRLNAPGRGGGSAAARRTRAGAGAARGFREPYARADAYARPLKPPRAASAQSTRGGTRTPKLFPAAVLETRTDERIRPANWPLPEGRAPVGAPVVCVDPSFESLRGVDSVAATAADR